MSDPAAYALSTIAAIATIALLVLMTSRLPLAVRLVSAAVAGVTVWLVVLFLVGGEQVAIY